MVSNTEDIVNANIFYYMTNIHNGMGLEVNVTLGLG